MIPIRTEPLFLGHGSPLNIKAGNRYTRFLDANSVSVGKPRAIVVVSAHWVTRGTFITSAEKPAQLYDFYGFPPDLYEAVYAPSGAPEIAAKIASLVPAIQLDSKRGIDHAAWSPLSRLLPSQDVPLLELSLDSRMSFSEHFELAKKMKPLRDGGILFIGSGNIVHNLGAISRDDTASVPDWAKKLDRWYSERIIASDFESLINAPLLAPDFGLGAPTAEHFIPLLYFLGLLYPDEKPVTIHESFQNGSISMRCIGIRKWNVGR